MIITKSTLVYFTELTPALLHIFNVLMKIDELRGVLVMPEQLVITAIANGVHMQNSRHYTNEALDLRSNNFPTRESKRAFRKSFEDLLGPKFRVLLEGENTLNEHFHIQVRKGETF